MGANIRSIELIANTASGSVGPGAPEEARAILAEFGGQTNVCVPENGELSACLQAAIDRGPDLLVILAGDGTARAAAELCGMHGPRIAPLPGGTMNMLPKAVYGTTDWKAALRDTLEHGVERPLGGGIVDGRLFLVAAILGSGALLAPAREAVREGRPLIAFHRARRAWRRAFSGRLRYSLDGATRGKAEAMTFMCPIASRALKDDDQFLEAAALDPAGVAEALRIGLASVMGDWRDDPAVQSIACRQARLWASSGIPAVLDGEPARLRASVQVSWKSEVARVLAPPRAPDPKAEH
ncbi:MAG: NAD(+)/NADH kinase [Phenylobacterium sp.]|jgi:diacylglycerol kinase family enzyme|uniref:diacylglycerol/lipid kinase family protein n=1 Tax=Phenylobacterium sp. TaxID=1871053 RepID=UPI001B58FC17|nr:diacylglycerol kinase family protein [Phenylobacterium sp.]MBP7816778.1 NAD(+)/NADH kinase [Phenylobacterium sp.]MBP9230420.1 NAD(+)/NADH kinase [Phenylobacterium sp.]MBP9754918.1 NAD(+)/NADH kinase [Phenylobacterium sp.]